MGRWGVERDGLVVKGVRWRGNCEGELEAEIFLSSTRDVDIIVSM